MKKPRKPYKLKKRNDRGGQYAIIDKATGKCVFTGTTDKDEAEKLAKIEFGLTDDSNAAFHMKLAEAHLAKCNSEWLTNTWGMIVKRLIAGPRQKYGGEKKAGTTACEKSNWNNKCWDDLRHKRLIDTTACDFERALAGVGIGLVEFGKKIHNYAINHKLMPYPIMGIEMWPKHDRKRMSRAVTESDHLKILKHAKDPTLDTYRQMVIKNKGTTRKQWRDEWVNWLWFLWYTGASNTDAATMRAENIRWEKGVLEYMRGKWIKPEKHAPARVAIAKGGHFEKLLKSLPATGKLFPLLSKGRRDNRCRTFAAFAEWVGIPKVTIHGYRFGFAERAKESGMSVEDRMSTLGHGSPSMADHYSMNAEVVPQSIEVLDGGLEAA